MESICRRHPLRMRSTPGVDPGFFIFTLLFFPTWYVIWGGGGGEGGGGEGGGQSMTVVECVCAERADYCILPCPLYHLLKTFYDGSNSNAG